MYGRKFESDFTPLYDIFYCFEPKNKGFQALIQDIFESYQQFSEKLSTPLLITHVKNFSAVKPNSGGVFVYYNHAISTPIKKSFLPLMQCVLSIQRAGVE